MNIRQIFVNKSKILKGKEGLQMQTTEAIKKDVISFLLEIDNTTNLTFADEDFKRAEAIMEKARNEHKTNFCQ